MYRFFLSIVLLLLVFVSCKKPKDNYEVVIPSPNGHLHLHFNLHKGEPYYLVYLDDEIVVGWSLLGFKNDGSAKDIFEEESLQENMLAMEVNSIKNDDDLSQIIAGEKYNTLKVHLQNQSDRKIGYDVVFLIYNETILFWYEYEPELQKIIANLKENTELDLNTKNQEWQLIDTIQRTDTLFSPVKFSSDLGIGLIFSQTNAKKNNADYLVQREDNMPEFLISSESSDTPDNIPDQFSKIKTPIKSIHIYRNK